MANNSRVKGVVVFLVFVFIFAVIGTANYRMFKATSPLPLLSKDMSMDFTLPYDIKRFPNEKFICKNSGDEAVNYNVTFLTAKSGASYSGRLSSKKKVTKQLKKLLSKYGVKELQGVIGIEGDVNCFLQIGNFVLSKDDVQGGTSYLQDSTTKNVKNNYLVVYNPGFDDIKLSLKQYTDEGKLELEREIKVKALKSKAIKAKYNGDKTYHLIPQDSSYVAIVRKKYNGKNTIKRAVTTFGDTSIEPKGILTVSNVTSVPATFRYVVTENGEKRYQGEEWVLPYAQRKIDLSLLEKSSSLQISPVSYYYPEICEEDGKCYADESYGDYMLIMSQKGEAINDSLEEDKIEYSREDVTTPSIPVSCEIDKTVKPHCGRDENANGIDDAEELFHYYADPSAEDADGDGYSNKEEIEGGTKAFHRYSFPGVPTANTIEGMLELSKLIESDVQNQRAIKVIAVENESDYSRLNKKGLKVAPVTGRAVQRPNTWIESVTREALWGVETDYRLGNNIIGHACSEINICINSKLNDRRETIRVADLAQGCLNVMRQAVGRVSGDECRYCKGDVKISKNGEECPPSSEGNITINLSGEPGRSNAGGDINLFTRNWGYGQPRVPESLVNDVRRYAICHELGHKFYWASDRYNDSNAPGSLYGPASDYRSASDIISCLTGYDMYNLQLMAIREQTGAPLSSIIASSKACITADRKNGIQIDYQGSKGDCIEYPFSKTQQFCPPNGSSVPEANFPSGRDSFEPACYCNRMVETGTKGPVYCCEKAKDVNICNKDCCYHACVKSFGRDICCPHVVTVGEDKYCCEDPKLEEESHSDETLAAAYKACEEVLKCEPDESEYTDINGEKACCKNISLVTKSDGTKECCETYLQDELVTRYKEVVGDKPIACGDKCCAGIACLEGTDGTKKCCPESAPIACPGSPQGCCVNGCSNYNSGKKQGQCSECQDGREQCGLKCCEETQICNNGECQDCPEGTERVLDECRCKDKRAKCGGTKCCGENQICQNGECQNCPERAHLDTIRRECVCDDYRDVCGGTKCCGENQICQNGECQNCPERAHLDTIGRECVCDDYRAKCGGTKCCGENQICYNEECQDCPVGTQANRYNECICDDNRKVCGGDECCGKNQICQKGECQDCPSGTHLKSNVCLCDNDNRNMCGGKCCGETQICKKGECQDCPVGTHMDKHYECVCDGTNRDICGGKCCSENQICKKGECQDCPSGSHWQWNECYCDSTNRAVCGGECCSETEKCEDNVCVTAPQVSCASGEGCYISYSDKVIDCIGTKRCSLAEKEAYEKSKVGNQCKQMEDGSYCCAGAGYEQCFEGDA